MGKRRPKTLGWATNEDADAFVYHHYYSFVWKAQCITEFWICCTFRIMRFLKAEKGPESCTMVYSLSSVWPFGAKPTGTRKYRPVRGSSFRLAGSRLSAPASARRTSRT